MIFPSIETGTAMNARESENYLPILGQIANGRNSKILIPDPYH
jgi:hypothetical protein